MKTFISSQAKLAQPITDRPSDQVSYILDAYWNEINILSIVYLTEKNRQN